jgi:cell division protein ZapA (FtsZ GTPase activity inhibitor)
MICGEGQEESLLKAGIRFECPWGRYRARDVVPGKRAPSRYQCEDDQPAHLTSVSRIIHGEINALVVKKESRSEKE